LYGLVRRAPLGGVPAAASSTPERVSIPDVRDPEDVFAWLERVHGGFNISEYRRLLGAANPYKEGDATQGLAAADESSRENSRSLLANTTIRSLNAHPIFDDEVVRFADAQVDPVVRSRIEPWTVGELARFLLREPEDAIKAIMPGLSSDNIACAVKLMSNDELIAVGRKVFNPLPGSNVGAKGYMGARVQPNSPAAHAGLQAVSTRGNSLGDVIVAVEGKPVKSYDELYRALENHKPGDRVRMRVSTDGNERDVNVVLEEIE